MNELIELIQLTEDGGYVFGYDVSDVFGIDIVDS